MKNSRIFYAVMIITGLITFSYGNQHPNELHVMEQLIATISVCVFACTLLVVAVKRLGL